MFTPFKNRDVVKASTVVKVYRNLHRKNYSVVEARTGLVIGHSDCVMLVDAHFEVDEAGRRRVLEQQKKNVHAFAVGRFFWDHKIEPGIVSWRRVRYDPYFGPWFVDITSHTAVDDNPCTIYLDETGAYYYPRSGK